MGIRYNPALDGLRALAIALVVLLHCHVPGFGRGYVGVDLFFVLSGYLITRILAGGPIRLGDFYLRRARRLYPGLLAMLAVYLLAFPILRPNEPHLRDAMLAGLYLSDYAYAFWKIPLYLQHTWSLGVEEKFYLLWPVALIVLIRHRANLPRALAIAMLAAWAWLVVNWTYGWPLAFRFDTRVLGLIAGCWLAVVQLPAWLTAKRAALLGSVALLIALTMRINPLLPVSELAGVLLVTAATRHGRCPDTIAFIGKLSYGIYLWHFPLVKLVHGPWWVELSVVASLSVALAWLSYTTVERVVRSSDRRSCQPVP